MGIAPQHPRSGFPPQRLHSGRSRPTACSRLKPSPFLRVRSSMERVRFGEPTLKTSHIYRNKGPFEYFIVSLRYYKHNAIGSKTFLLIFLVDKLISYILYGNEHINSWEI